MLTHMGEESIPEVTHRRSGEPSGVCSLFSSVLYTSGKTDDGPTTLTVDTAHRLSLDVTRKKFMSINPVHLLEKTYAFANPSLPPRTTPANQITRDHHRKLSAYLIGQYIPYAIRAEDQELVLPGPPHARHIRRGRHHLLPRLP